MATRPEDQSSPAPQQGDTLYVGPDLFERGIQALVGLREAGKLRILARHSPRSPFQWEFRERDELVGQTVQEFDITLAELRKVIDDLDDSLMAIVAGIKEDHFVQVRSDPNRWQDGEVEDPDIARRKFQLTSSHFDVDDLRRRMWIKRTSKNDVPSSLTWEVVSKQVDHDDRAPAGNQAVYATLRLEAETPGAPLAASVVGGATEIVMTLDREDVGYMIDSLSRLKHALDDSEGTSKT